MICPNCGSNIADGSSVCPVCYKPINQAQTSYQQQPYQQPGYQQAGYQQAGYQQAGYQQPYYRPTYPVASQDASTAKILGIIAIIAAATIPLAAIICGIIGMSKAKKAIAENAFDSEAQQALKLNKIGLILGSVVMGLALLILIIMLVVIFAGFYW